MLPLIVNSNEVLCTITIIVSTTKLFFTIVISSCQLVVFTKSFNSITNFLMELQYSLSI